MLDPCTAPRRFHGSRLRTGRWSERGGAYLLTTVTGGREPVFRDLVAARILIRELRRAQEQGLAASLAWVVMPDHLHWMISLQGATLDQVMRTVKSRSARLVNRAHRRKPFRWQHGYHDRAFRAEEDLEAAARYVVLNPLRAGIVRSIWEYPHWDAIWVEPRR